MRNGQVTIVIILLLFIAIGIVARIYLQIQTDQMEIQRLNIQNIISTFSK